ncbi:MAG: potassium channel family protein [Candidatus Saccharibacteria bacterium]
MEPAQIFSTKRLFRLTALIALVLLVGGAIFFHYQEKWSWLNSFYFCTVTLATVGYGDFTPQTNLGKIVDIFYILGGIGVIVTFANLFVRRAGERAVERAKEREKTGKKKLIK